MVKRPLLTNIPMRNKLVPATSLHNDSKSAIDKVYNKTYNNKFRHIRLRHNLLKRLLKQEVIAIDFMRSKNNLADPPTKRLVRDQVILTLKGMRLKPKKNKSPITDT